MVELVEFRPGPLLLRVAKKSTSTTPWYVALLEIQKKLILIEILRKIKDTDAVELGGQPQIRTIIHEICVTNQTM